MWWGPLEMRCCCVCLGPLARLVITDRTAGNGFGRSRLGISRAKDLVVIRVGREGRGGRSWGLGWGGRLGVPFPSPCTHSRAWHLWESGGAVTGARPGLCNPVSVSVKGGRRRGGWGDLGPAPHPQPRKETENEKRGCGCSLSQCLAVVELGWGRGPWGLGPAL